MVASLLLLTRSEWVVFSFASALLAATIDFPLLEPVAGRDALERGDRRALRGEGMLYNGKKDSDGDERVLVLASTRIFVASNSFLNFDPLSVAVLGAIRVT